MYSFVKNTCLHLNSYQVPCNVYLYLILGWCFCKREQELGKLPGAILSSCSLTDKQIQSELVRLQEIREMKSVSNIPSTTDVTTDFEPECDYVEMNPISCESKQPAPRIPPPFKSRLDIPIKFPPSKSLSVHPMAPPVSPIQPGKGVKSMVTHLEDRKPSSLGLYVLQLNVQSVIM